MLYLELGGDKFQAQIAGTFNPEDFKVGETLRVRVERTEPEIVLRLISPQKRSTDLLLGTELEFVIMVIAVSCVKLLSAHNSTQHTSRKHKV
jgi:hypothetical protein